MNTYPIGFYVYAYLREDGTPYYIGKGKGNRIHSKSNRVFNPPPKERRIFLKQNLTEEEAFKHEIYMIDVFGRIDLGTGILHNRTNGGDGVSGAIVSEDQIDHLLHMAATTCERYYPAFQLACWGDQTPSSAMDVAIAEAYGHA